MPSQDQPDFLAAALSWAAQGFAVFPCIPNGKEPLGGNGHLDATTDESIIRIWWTESPAANIGVCPGHSGMFVLDDDPPRGAETIASLEMEHGLLPDTLTFRTPRGGLHRWFLGRCRSTVGKLGPNVDTRGYNGYVLLPPSRTDAGAYVCVNDVPLSAGPQWILDGANKEAEQHAHADVALDLGPAIDRAGKRLREYVERGDVAVAGAGGDSRTYQLFCELRDLGLSLPRAVSLAQSDFNPYCRPPWSSEELTQKAVNAFTYSQNRGPAYAVAPGAQTFAAVAESLAAAPAEKRSRFFPHELTDLEAFSEPTWLVPGLIPERGTVQITGRQKSFKTFLALDLALGLAAGDLTFGHVPVAAPVVYIAGENASAIALKHVPAWCLSRAQEPGLLPFRLVQNMPHAAFQEEVAELVAVIHAEKIKPALVVIDTATRALRGLDENNAKDMGVFSAACEFIQRELNCTVIVIRHTGKDESRGGRGSNVIEGDFDTILDVERHEKSPYVQLRVREQRNAAEREEPYSFEMQQVGPSLVAQPVTVAEFQQATRRDDAFAPGLVGAALVNLKALGEGNAVNSYILATELVPAINGESPEERDRALKRVEKTLRARARGILAGYATGEGHALRWFVEEPTT